jgi:hypothetical protein
MQERPAHAKDPLDSRLVVYYSLIFYMRAEVS